MDKKELRKKIYSKIDELPTLPVVVTRLLGMFEDKKSNTASLTEAIEKDPSLTSKVLKVANSAYYGFSHQIASLDRAVAILGFNMVKSLVISIGVMKTMPSDKKTSLFSEKELWHHSITVAVVLREMGRRHYPDRRESELFFITGLIHDIGLIVFDQFFHNLFEDVLNENSREDRERMCLAEKKIIGLDHGEVGGMLLERWNFPEEISNPVLFHHADEFQDGKNKEETALLKAADAVSHINSNDEYTDKVKEKIEYGKEFEGLDRKIIYDMIHFKDNAKDEIDSFFNSMI